MPQWYLDEPPLSIGDSFYITAFWRLNTHRPSGFSLGKIPWFLLVEYGHHVGLDDDTIELFETVIYAMDEAYIAWSTAEADKAKNQGGKGKSS